MIDATRENEASVVPDEMGSIVTSVAHCIFRSLTLCDNSSKSYLEIVTFTDQNLPPPKSPRKFAPTPHTLRAYGPQDNAEALGMPLTES